MSNGLSPLFDGPKLEFQCKSLFWFSTVINGRICPLDHGTDDNDVVLAAIFSTELDFVLSRVLCKTTTPVRQRVFIMFKTLSILLFNGFPLFGILIFLVQKAYIWILISENLFYKIIFFHLNNIIDSFKNIVIVINFSTTFL